MAVLYFAVVCSSNMNRSMQAHSMLDQEGYRVKSFGTGEKVKLPGRGNKPNCYEFGVPYADIYNDLLVRDHFYYQGNGVLNMLKRNQRVKYCPERFQDSKERFDVIIACEKRVYDDVIESFPSEQTAIKRTAYVINLEIKDNLEESILGGYLIVELASKLTQAKDLSTDIAQVLEAFENKCKKRVMYCVVSY